MTEKIICDKRMEKALRAVAEELADGDWEKLTVRDFRVIEIVLAVQP